MTNHLQDRTIVGVAVPTISNEFNSFGDISWYESAYLLTFCAFQLPMGKVYVRNALPSPSLCFSLNPTL
jgi:MFS family permease